MKKFAIAIALLAFFGCSSNEMKQELEVVKADLQQETLEHQKTREELEIIRAQFRITSYNVCYTKLLRFSRRLPSVPSKNS